MKKYKIKYWVASDHSINWYVTRWPYWGGILSCIGSACLNSYEDAEEFIKKLQDADNKIKNK